jgi:uncharacterized protein YhbP (UPF0306 family)
MIPEPVSSLLLKTTLSLATVSADGEPHIAPVYFAAHLTEKSGIPFYFELYFFSEQKSRHAKDLARDPRAAVSIYPENVDWNEIHGLQMRGVVQPVPLDEEWDAVWEHFKKKFPFVNGLRLLVARNTMYVFKPRWLRLVDNRQRFGFKQEWVFE